MSAGEVKSAVPLSTMPSTEFSSPSSQVPSTASKPSDVSNPLLAMLRSSEDTPSSARPTPLTTDLASSFDGLIQGASSPVTIAPSPKPALGASNADATRTSQQYNPPPIGSRFHALGARGSVPAALQRPTDPAIASMGSPQQIAGEGPSYPSPNNSSQLQASLASLQQIQEVTRMQSDARERHLLESLRAQQALSGFESPSNQLFPDRGLDMGGFGQTGEYRRMGTGSPVSPYPDMGPNPGQGVSQNAVGMDGMGGAPFAGGRGGSRFAKLWDTDARNRQGLPGAGRGQNPGDLGPYQVQTPIRQDNSSLGNGHNGSGQDVRIPDHLLAMMNGSTQVSFHIHDIIVRWLTTSLADGSSEPGPCTLCEPRFLRRQLPEQSSFTTTATATAIRRWCSS
jgi:hypothetical protein